jgi:mannose-1-phosphate guanylyltransferase
MNLSKASAWTGSGHDQGDSWATVLAGGEGARLRPLTRYVCGDDRPKQYAALLDSRSLLQLTLERVGLGVPPERTVVVVRRHHTGYLAGVVSSPSRLLIQPHDRGTAVGVLWPAVWISWGSSEATAARGQAAPSSTTAP